MSEINNFIETGNILDNLKSSDQVFRDYDTGLRDTYEWHKHEMGNTGIYYYLSPEAKKITEGKSQKKFSVWILGGIHGEEIAPPNALSSIKTLKILGELGKNEAMLCAPLINPKGYESGIRNINEAGSVTNSEHLLPKNNRLFLTPSSNESVSGTNETVTQHMLELMNSLKPALVFDHHEDIYEREYSKHDPRSITGSYIFVNSTEKIKFTAARIGNEILDAIKQAGLSIQLTGSTDIGEHIDGGMVWNVKDMSIDRLLVSGYYLDKDGKMISKHKVPLSYVIETTVPFGENIPLETRLKAHENVISRLPSIISQLSLRKLI